MKLAQDRPKPDDAARRLLEIANTTEADQGKVDVGQINIIFLREGGSPDDTAPAYSA